MTVEIPEVTKSRDELAAEIIAVTERYRDRVSAFRAEVTRQIRSYTMTTNSYIGAAIRRASQCDFDGYTFPDEWPPVALPDSIPAIDPADYSDAGLTYMLGIITSAAEAELAKLRAAVRSATADGYMNASVANVVLSAAGFDPLRERTVVTTWLKVAWEIPDGATTRRHELRPAIREWAESSAPEGWRHTEGHITEFSSFSARNQVI